MPVLLSGGIRSHPRVAELRRQRTAEETRRIPERGDYEAHAVSGDYKHNVQFLYPTLIYLIFPHALHLPQHSHLQPAMK